MSGNINDLSDLERFKRLYAHVGIEYTLLTFKSYISLLIGFKSIDIGYGKDLRVVFSLDGQFMYYDPYGE